MYDKTGRKPHEGIDPPHFLAVPACQIIVDRHHMNAFAGQRVQICGHGGHQRFTLAGFHFGNSSLMQNNAAQKLNIERTLSQHPVVRFTHGRKSIR